MWSVFFSTSICNFLTHKHCTPDIRRGFLKLLKLSEIPVKKPRFVLTPCKLSITRIFQLFFLKYRQRLAFWRKIKGVVFSKRVYKRLVVTKCAPNIRRGFSKVSKRLKATVKNHASFWPHVNSLFYVKNEKSVEFEEKNIQTYKI